VLLLMILAEPPCPEIACELDVDLAMPTPVAVDDLAPAGPLAAIVTMAAATATMAADKSRSMCSSFYRAGRMKIHNTRRPAD
jgi:hypothetical protein